MNAPARLTGLPPVSRPDARVLVLGSMPGAASLAAQRYYAHPRNAFWPIMDAIAGASPDLPYAQRLARLRAAGIALWDVLAHCVRPGSLDARIEPASMVANDFAAFFSAHPQLRLVAFNGGTAAQAFARHAGPALPPGVATVRLPSTSPAHAARSQAEKLASWRAALAPYLAPG
ncbi:DNA-deoxyinosine glycosylase [Luteimonas huabeiensis]|uniref:DNA-deoxyinosine glycosylase n=1 Tax=Luteimonas huabeiensis TaxID=1244513 RepID=UPI0004650A69|nr:DNA-deoxyinosine glycosylase [Luteimonas huabeiensis]